MAENILKVLQERTKDATATADDLAQGKTAYAVAIANCNANTTNVLKITTKTVGINVSVAKNYKVYGIK